MQILVDSHGRAIEDAAFLAVQNRREMNAPGLCRVRDLDLEELIWFVFLLDHLVMLHPSLLPSRINRSPLHTVSPDQALLCSCSTVQLSVH